MKRKRKKTNVNEVEQGDEFYQKKMELERKEKVFLVEEIG